MSDRHTGAPHRRYRFVQIRAGQQILNAADPLRPFPPGICTNLLRCGQRQAIGYFCSVEQHDEPCKRIVGYIQTTKPDPPHRLKHGTDSSISSNSAIGVRRYRAVTCGAVVSDRRGMNVFHRVRPDALQALCAALDAKPRSWPPHCCTPIAN